MSNKLKAQTPANTGVMQKITGFFTELMRRYLPDPFVFAVVLTLLTFVLAFAIQRQNPVDAVLNWGEGFWGLLAFTTQMAVILAAGFVLANSPVVDRLLDRIVSSVHTPKAAIVVATLVGGFGSYLNWGFGLVIGGVVARKLATEIKGVHYPLIIASAYSGFTMYGLGLSATIPLTIATPGHPLEEGMGLIGLDQTIFAPPMVVTAIAVMVSLPILNAALHPKPGQSVREIDPGLFATADKGPITDDFSEDTFANKLNKSRTLSMVIGLAGILYVVFHMVQGGKVDLNLINFIILFLGIILMGNPIAYVNKLNEGIKTVSGIILQFPFYAGIMAIMAGSGLVVTISGWFVNVSTAESLPFWGLVSSFVINFFAPSGGGHWVIQGPFMIEAAHTLGASMPQTAMSVMLGNAWNDLVQPFWILPALALSRLKLKDIMGYTVVMMFWVGLVYIVAILAWGFLG
ncbi:short-chain fatty acid transporter [Paeniglutamicibacter sp.]|uniref:short-chain fatty acid transporter n=1 Tax=Paeniglutamicibacter sp. TaxID=1934391 RepID=UPI00398A4368